MFESLRVKAAGNIMDMLDSGGKITYIDPRAAGTAMKATRYWAIRPGTDYALNLGIIHTVLRDKLYDAQFVNKWVDGLKELESFVIPYTPEWAEKETGIAAREIVAFAHEIAEDSPGGNLPPGLDDVPLFGFFLCGPNQLHSQCADGRLRDPRRSVLPERPG